MKYKRVVISREGGPDVLQVVEENLPQPDRGEVRVEVLTTGVLLADILWQSGMVPGSPKPPFTPGGKQLDRQTARREVMPQSNEPQR